MEPSPDCLHFPSLINRRGKEAGESRGGVGGGGGVAPRNEKNAEKCKENV